MSDPKNDDEELPPDFEEANAFGDAIWGALQGSFRTCGSCKLPWRSGQRVCTCGWFPDPSSNALN